VAIDATHRVSDVLASFGIGHPIEDFETFEEVSVAGAFECHIARRVIIADEPNGL